MNMGFGAVGVGVQLCFILEGHGLTLLYSGLIPILSSGGARGSTIQDAGNQTQVSSIQGKYLTRCAIILALDYYSGSSGL